MKYKIEDIRAEAEKNKWLLISEKYTNLDTELEFICPEKHQVFLTYRKWRVYHDCPICRNNPLKAKEMKIIAKPSSAKRVLAFDQATNISGWAVFDNQKLVQCGKFQANQATAVERIETMREWVASMINMWQPDKVAIEDIQLQQFGPKSANNTEGVTTYKVLAQLQGVLINYFYINHIQYDIIHTATWRAYCGVKGKTRSDKKKSAQIIVKHKWDAAVTQDEADAILIGYYEAEKNFKAKEMVDWS